MNVILVLCEMTLKFEYGHLACLWASDRPDARSTTLPPGRSSLPASLYTAQPIRPRLKTF